MLLKYIHKLLILDYFPFALFHSQPPRKKLRTQDSEVDLSEDNADESNDDEEDDDENEDEEPQNTPSMSLADDEELAMKLLNG